MTEYLPISSYGVIGNCRSAALVSKQGSIDWCCLPRFDSNSLFAKILDPKKGGSFAIAPMSPYNSTQKYVEDTNVLVTTFHTQDGSVEVTDFFVVQSKDERRGELIPEHEIIRIVKGVKGRVRMRLRYHPRWQFGVTGDELVVFGNRGIKWSLGQHMSMLLMDGLDLPQIRRGDDGDYAQSDFDVKMGEEKSFSLTFCDHTIGVIPPMGTRVGERLSATIRYWKSWTNHCGFTGQYRKELIRSALALKLNVFAPSGAIIAAPTTSLPEVIGGERNWDYRFCWLRDAALTVQALVRLGYYDEADAFSSWILHTTRLTRPRLQVLYSLYGESRGLGERTIDLRGYRNSRPVRVGNSAYNQFQADTYGEVIDALYVAHLSGQKLDLSDQKFLRDLGNSVCKIWHQPDEGIWEVRSGKQHHTHSKVLCWVALDKLIKMARRESWKLPFDQFEQTRSQIEEYIENNCFSKKLNAYVGIANKETLDASLLTMGIYGYKQPDHPRIVGTRRAIERELMEDGFVYRYRHQNDGLSGQDGAFVAATLWYVSQLALEGETQKARAALERILDCQNELGLLSEEIDPKSKEFLGNFPQAFSHVALINAVLHISEAKQARKMVGA